MDRGTSSLTVFFEEPFWVGVFQREEGGRYEACRVVFGAEPRDAQVYDLILHRWRGLRFSPSLPSSRAKQCLNPKRMQREIHRLVESRGVGTKAQQALSRQREQDKLERKAVTRQQREAEDARRFALRQEKKREKRRGH